MSANDQILRMTPLQYRGLLDTSGSAVCFASATGSRWNLTGFSIGWTNVSTRATFQFVEGTDATAFFQFDVSTSQGYAACNLGNGIQASATGSSFRFFAGTSLSGSYSVAFTGYRSGG